MDQIYGVVSDEEYTPGWRLSLISPPKGFITEQELRQQEPSEAAQTAAKAAMKAKGMKGKEDL